MKQVVKVLEGYSRSDEQMVSMFNGDGEILWGKTIDESFALIEDNRPYYKELYTGKTVDDDMDYFKRLHECILTECSNQLRQAQLENLFGIETVELSEEIPDDFGDREYILERISKELNVQFNTHRQILLKTLYAYVAQNRRMFEDANRKKLNLRFSDNNVVFSENGNLEIHFVNLTVTNIGNRNVIIKNWGIKVSKKQNLLIVPDVTNPIVRMIQKPLPCTLEPEETMDLVFDIKLFLRNLREQVKKGVFSEKDRLILYVVDGTGKMYCVKSEKSIKKYIDDNTKYE